MDDQLVGRALRRLRQRLGWRQIDLAIAASVSQTLVSRAERGRIGSLRWDDIRSMFNAVDAGCSITPWWRSGAIDRLLDEDHAMLVARAAAYLKQRGWTIEAEVSFAVYRERGSIDLLALRPSDGAVLVVEIKSRLMSIEELLRTLDRKVRLAPQIVAERFGWTPRVVGRLVVLGEDTTNRRRVDGAEILDVALPLRAVALRAWLAEPRLPAAAGLLFLPLSPGATGKRRIAARQRVRRVRPRTNIAPRQPRRGGSPTEESPGD